MTPREAVVKEMGSERRGRGRERERERGGEGGGEREKANNDKGK